MYHVKLNAFTKTMHYKGLHDPTMTLNMFTIPALVHNLDLSNPITSIHHWSSFLSMSEISETIIQIIKTTPITSLSDLEQTVSRTMLHRIKKEAPKGESCPMELGLRHSSH